MDQKKFITLYKFLFLIWFFFIFIVSVYPGNLIGLILFGDPTTYPGGDKINHFISYFILGLLSFFSFKNSHKFKSIIYLLISFSILIELSHLLIPNRFYENLDLIMNFVGLISGIFIFNLKKTIKI